MAPWIRRPQSASSRRIAPAPGYDPKRHSSNRNPDHIGRHRPRSASTSRNVTTDDKGYNGQTITYRVFNGRGLSSGAKAKHQQKGAEVVKPESHKSKNSRRSSMTVEDTVDSIPTRDESSSSDIDGGRRATPQSLLTKAREPDHSTKPTNQTRGTDRNAYSQGTRESGSGSRPRSAGPSYSRPTISTGHQRPWHQSGSDNTRVRPSSASAARSAPTNPILETAEQSRPRPDRSQSQGAERSRTHSTERSRPQADHTQQPQSADRGRSTERSRPYDRTQQPQSGRPHSTERSRPQPDRIQQPQSGRPHSTERSRPQPDRTQQPQSGRPHSTERSRPEGEAKPVSSGNGVKCYPLAVHLQQEATKTAPLSSKTPPAFHSTEKAKSTANSSSSKPAPSSSSDKGTKQESAISERAHLEQMLCSSRPKDRSSTDFYSFGEVVGTGSFAKVRVAVHKLTGQRVAIKTYEKNKIKDAHALKRISQEIKLMERLDHPLISRFFEAIESARRIHIVMELIGEGNLCSYIKEKKSLREDEARNIFTQLCSAVEYLHSQHITHRDIKLENVLFDSQRNVKLIDFGFSVQCKEPKTLKVFCGTPSYMAPEIVRRSEYLGKPVDMWSLGVVLFAMLSGCFPFSAKTYPDLYKKVLKGSFKFPESFSPVVRHLVTNLLCGDANRRMKVAVAKAHPWLKSQPEVNFKYTPTATFTVSADAREDLYREAVNRMTTLGVDETTLCNDVCGKRRNSLTTCYYLLASAMSLRNKPGGL